jgi:carboxyl-terminal processing protease
MKKTLLYMGIFLSLLLMTGCQEQTTDLEDTSNDIILESIEVDSDTVSNTYTLDSFSLDDIELILFFNDGTETNIDLISSMVEQDIDSVTETGTYTFDVTYLSKETSFIIDIEDYYEVNAIDINNYNPYALISSFDINDIKLILTLDNDETKEIPLTYDMLNQANANKLFREGIHEITVQYQGLQTSFMIALFSEYPTPEVFKYTEDEAIFYEVLELLQDYHYSNPSKDDLYKNALNGLIESLDDPYTRYLNPESLQEYTEGISGSYVGLGFHSQIIDGLIVIIKIVADSSADEEGLMRDDIIHSIDDHIVTKDNAVEMNQMLLGKIGETITLEIERAGIDYLMTFELEFQNIDTQSVVVDEVIDGSDKYGIITVNSFGIDTADSFEDAIVSLEDDTLKGIVIDLRNNPGGYTSAVLDMLQKFLLDNGRPIFLYETYTSAVSSTHFYGVIDEVKPYDIVVLVNENSASASEVFAISMQEHGGYQVIGTKTYGKGVVQTFVNIDEKPDDYLIVTYAKWFSPLGNWVDRNGGTSGVLPDIIAEKNQLESLQKVYLSNDEIIEYDTVDKRLERIQIILNGMGYSLRTDGYFDEATKLAIEDIQSNNDLTITGDIDQETLTIINDWLDNYQANTDTQLDKALETLKNS